MAIEFCRVAGEESEILLQMAVSLADWRKAAPGVGDFPRPHIDPK